MTSAIGQEPIESAAIMATDVTSHEAKSSNAMSVMEFMRAFAVQASQDFTALNSLLQQSQVAQQMDLVSKRLSGATSAEDLLKRIEGLLGQKGFDPVVLAHLEGLKAKTQDSLDKIEDQKAKIEDKKGLLNEIRGKRDRDFLNGLTLGLNKLGMAAAVGLTKRTIASMEDDLVGLEIEGKQAVKDNIESVTSDLDKNSSKLADIQSKIDASQSSLESAGSSMFFGLGF